MHYWDEVTGAQHERVVIRAANRPERERLNPIWQLATLIFERMDPMVAGEEHVLVDSRPTDSNVSTIDKHEDVPQRAATRVYLACPRKRYL